MPDETDFLELNLELILDFEDKPMTLKRLIETIHQKLFNTTVGCGKMLNSLLFFDKMPNFRSEIDSVGIKAKRFMDSMTVRDIIQSIRKDQSIQSDDIDLICYLKNSFKTPKAISSNQVLHTATLNPSLNQLISSIFEIDSVYRDQTSRYPALQATTTSTQTSHQKTLINNQNPTYFLPNILILNVKQVDSRFKKTQTLDFKFLQFYTQASESLQSEYKLLGGTYILKDAEDQLRTFLADESTIPSTTHAAIKQDTDIDGLGYLKLLVYERVTRHIT